MNLGLTKILDDVKAASLRILKGLDQGKDQTYFCRQYPQRSWLAACFPLGTWQKSASEKWLRILDYRIIVKKTAPVFALSVSAASTIF